MRTLGLHSTTLSPSGAAASSPQSLWHSPVSYLFGGLAAMTGLIAFALLVLACSYCHLSRPEDDGASRPRQADVEQAKTGGGAPHRASPVFEDKFLVIMAGQDLPTFLATPSFTKASLLAPAAGEERDGQLLNRQETEQVNGHGPKSTEETSSERDRTD